MICLMQLSVDDCCHDDCNCNKMKIVNNNYCLLFIRILTYVDYRLLCEFLCVKSVFMCECENIAGPIRKFLGKENLIKNN